MERAPKHDPGSPRPRRVAIVGGGIGGLSCARVLAAAGHRVTIFDKARKPGGRCSTRRVDGRRLSFDHGAQYFTVRDPGFAELVARWRELGAVEAWRPRLWALDARRRGASRGPVEPGTERFVAIPGMSTLPRLLVEEIDAAGEVEIHASTRITEVAREKFDWELRDAEGQAWTRYNYVVLNLPAGQAAPLLSHHADELRAIAEACEMQPCWTLMLAPTRPVELEYDAAFVSGSPLAWFANNASKPGRPPAQCWVLQASGEWSRDNFERDAEEVARELLAAWSELVDRQLDAQSFVTAHRWRYAKPSEPVAATYLHDSRGLGIGVCGDWCGGPRVEGAFVSGRDLARAMLERFAC